MHVNLTWVLIRSAWAPVQVLQCSIDQSLIRSNFKDIMYLITATLKDIGDNKILHTQRETQLKERQIKYAWKKSTIDGLPSHIATDDQLPQDERFEQVKNINFITASLEGAAKLKLGGCDNITDLHDYEKLATILGDPEVPVHNAARWTTDVEFGRQMMNGVNPVVIQKCTALSSNFPVTNDMVKGFLNRGLTLKQEMEVCQQSTIYSI